MTLIDKLNDEMLSHIAKAEESLRALMSLSQDWTARIMMENEIEHFKTECHQFVTHQFGPTPWRQR